MPRKPKSPCHYPGCPNLCDDYYCEAHKAKAGQEYNRYRRDPETSKRYGYAWRKVRAAYIEEHPLCEQCLKEGRLTPVEEVHHILPLADGGTHEFSNLMSLCKSCHSSFTAKATNGKTRTQ